MAPPFFPAKLQVSNLGNDDNAAQDSNAASPASIGDERCVMLLSHELPEMLCMRCNKMGACACSDGLALTPEDQIIGRKKKVAISKQGDNATVPGNGTSHEEEEDNGFESDSERFGGRPPQRDVDPQREHFLARGFREVFIPLSAFRYATPELAAMHREELSSSTTHIYMRSW